MSKLLVTEIEPFSGITIGIGATVSQPSSILTFTSTTQGIILPRMTTTQRNAISTPLQGLIIYNISTDQIERYDGSAWHSGVDLASSDVSGILPVVHGGTGASTLTLNNVILGNGSSAVQFVAPGTSGNLLTSNGTTWTSTAPATNGTVTSVALTVPSIFSVSGSPITTSGTLAVTLNTETANTVFAGPTTGGAATPTFRSLVAADIPTISLTTGVSGILPVANGGTSLGSLTANNVILGNGTSAPNFVAPGSSGNLLTSNGTTWVSSAPATNGTVTSVALTVPSFLSVSGSPITTSGTLAVTLATETANTIFAGPTSGGAATPTFRAMVVADLVAHNLLSASHGDTLADTVIRGDVIIGNSTPKWSRLPIGSASTLFQTNGTDPSWGTVNLLSAFHGDTLAGSVTRGDLIIGNSTPKWSRFAVGGASTLLTTNGTDPAWSTINLLSAFHADTTPASPVRGDIMIAGSTPTWTKLAIGSTARVLRSNGTDPSWGQVVLTSDVSGLLPTGNIATNVLVAEVGVSLDGGGSTLTTGQKGYITVPFAGTISAWNITVDTGTCTLDVWKIATGTAIPTVTNTITAAAKPAISTGTAIHSTTLTAWTTSVTANDIFGFNLDAVSGATKISLVLQINKT